MPLTSRPHSWSAVATMVAVRKSKRAMFPRIVVQCLVTSANENGLVIVRQRALSMGADVVEFKTLHLHHGKVTDNSSNSKRSL